MYNIFSTYLANKSNSKFTIEPIPLYFKVVLFQVCGITDTVNVKSVIRATVRLIPLTAIEPCRTIYFLYCIGNSIVNKIPKDCLTIEVILPIQSI